MSKAKSMAVVPGSNAALTDAGSVDQGGAGGVTPGDQANVDHGSKSGRVLDEQAAYMALVDVVKARVLVVCEYGEPNDVVELSATLVRELRDVVDADPAAVAYAQSMQKK